jgi:hypothetical protein
MPIYESDYCLPSPENSLETHVLMELVFGREIWDSGEAIIVEVSASNKYVGSDTPYKFRSSGRSESPVNGH